MRQSDSREKRDWKTKDLFSTIIKNIFKAKTANKDEVLTREIIWTGSEQVVSAFDKITLDIGTQSDTALV